MDQPPQTLGEFIDAIRAGLVCDRCGRYVGALTRKRFLPAPYPVALDQIGAEDEAEALVAFEWHMTTLLKRQLFLMRHPQKDGQCVSAREWAAGAAEADADPADTTGATKNGK